MIANSPDTLQHQTRMARVCASYGYAAGCIVPGCTNAPILHHFVARREGGTNAIENLIPICKKHEAPLHKAGVYARKWEREKPTAKQEKRAMIPLRSAKEKVAARTTSFLYGCTDCFFMHTAKPAWCEVCKTPGTRLSCIRSDSPTLRSVQRLAEPTTKQAKRQAKLEARAQLEKEDPMHAEHLKFERIQRAKKTKRFSAYGGDLRTNLAAPFIVRLRKAAQKAKGA
jgi:hypothetical protein